MLATLSLLEEFLLLALNDVTGTFYSLSRSTFDCATMGAILMDLSLCHRIDNDLSDIFVLDNAPTFNPILDPSLALMAEAPVLQPRPIMNWLQELSHLSEGMREEALRHLEAVGILKREEAKLLWVFGARRYPLIHQAPHREVKLRVLAVILRDDVPLPHDIMLVTLAHACGLFRHILNDHELTAAKARIKDVARMDLIGQAVARAVAEIETAIAMASGFR